VDRPQLCPKARGPSGKPHPRAPGSIRAHNQGLQGPSFKGYKPSRSNFKGGIETIEESDGLRWIIRPESYFGGVIQDRLGPEKRELPVLVFIKDHADPQGVFVDVGAALGGHALRLAKYFKEVIAIEPFPFFFKGLERNISLNKITNVRAFNMACLAKHGELWFARDFKVGLPYRGFRVKMKPGMVPVEAHPLDEVVEEARVIKIDTEGWELEVLEGAKELLRRCKPALAIEAHEHTHKIAGQEERIKQFLTRMGYNWRVAYRSMYRDAHINAW